MPLWQTYGTPRGALDLWQNRQDALCGVSVDFNECAADGWRPEEKEVAFKDDPDAIAYRSNVLSSFEAHVAAIGDLTTRIRVLENDDTVDDAAVADLKVRLDKLRLI